MGPMSKVMTDLCLLVVFSHAKVFWIRGSATVLKEQPHAKRLIGAMRAGAIERISGGERLLLREGRRHVWTRCWSPA